MHSALRYLQMLCRGKQKVIFARHTVVKALQTIMILVNIIYSNHYLHKKYVGNRNPSSASFFSLNAGLCASAWKKINIKEIVFDLVVSIDLHLFEQTAVWYIAKDGEWYITLWLLYALIEWFRCNLNMHVLLGEEEYHRREQMYDGSKAFINEVREEERCLTNSVTKFSQNWINRFLRLVP